MTIPPHTLEPHRLSNVLLRLDAWLDTMRGPAGYGGPVAHWWQNCLLFTGAGIDWRYEGIVIGYLNLYEATGQQHWLDKACHAGDDIVRGQHADGNFRNSTFEMNPSTGGTPHEAACSLALLQLARVLRQRGDLAWQTYLAVAGRNLWQYAIHRLWDAQARSFRDALGKPSLVPNKAATLVEALLLLAHLTGDESLVVVYALPTLDAILRHQVQGGTYDGAIYQNSFGSRPVVKFFPYYIARCVPGLLAGYAWSHEERYLDAARRAMGFVLRWRYADGSFPQVVYPGGRVNRYPQWVAAVGDVLRAMHLLAPYGVAADAEPTRTWLLHGQQPAGGFATGWGFAAQISQRPPASLPDFRDILPVCGWCDKPFRYLTELVLAEPGDLADQVYPDTSSVFTDYETICTLHNQRLHYSEKRGILELYDEKSCVYRWRKGEAWVEVATSGFYLK